MDMENKTPNSFGKLGSSFEGFMTAGATIDHAIDDVETLKDTKDPQDEVKHSPLVSYIKERFERSKDRRKNDEMRWLRAYSNYRGQYAPFTEFEKSQIFMKITKTKVLAAYSQIIDILFSNNKFPLGIEPSPVPLGIAESVHFDPQEPQSQGGSTNTVVRPDILEELGPYKEKLSGVEDKLKNGPGTSPTSVTFEPAKEAAKKMEKKFFDQLAEADANKTLRLTVFEMALLGSGAYKGPVAKKKEYPKWDKQGSYSPIEKTIADFHHVSIWNLYPDPEVTKIEDAEYLIERHKMNKTQLRALKNRPHFREDVIEEVIKDGPNYEPEYWESTLEDYKSRDQSESYEVLEFWGIADKDFEELTDIKIPNVYKDKDQVQINIFICNNRIIRLAYNPFTPARIPYFLCPYELNPYSIFGVGVAENMEDTQTLMNGFMRLAVDNGILSSNISFEVNKTYLEDGQDMTMRPGKVYYTEGNAGQAIHSLKWDNVTTECLMLFDKARQLADEATGIPSYSHGQSNIQSIGRTASGMSMLMGASAQNIKTVVKNIDDYLLMPLGRSLFAFNMQFFFDEEIVGDLDIVPRATESLMRNEIRAQRLQQALQTTANPMDAPFVRRDYILRELFQSNDIDPDKAVNDPREAVLQAEAMKKLNEAMGIDPNKMAQGSPPPAGPQGPNTPTTTPNPGSQGFSSNGGTGGTPPNNQPPGSRMQ